MLLVGTTSALWDLDRSYALVDGAAVTALGRAGGLPVALLDGERLCRVGEDDVEPFAALDRPDGQSLAATAAGTIVVGRSGARLAVVDPGGGGVEPVESFDQVPGRGGWHNPANPTPDLRTLAVAGGAVLAGVHVGGVWRSEDLRLWQQVVETDADVHEVTTEGETAALAAAVGFGWSLDGGRSWRFSSEGLHARYCRAVALQGGAVYLSASGGPWGDRSVLYRAPRAGEPFVRCAGGLPEFFPANIDSGTLAAAPGRVVFGTESGEVWASDDGGDSWTRLAAELGRVTAVLA